MLKALYTCDQCGAEKKETNHWFAVRVFTRTVKILPFEEAIQGDKHACGDRCLLALVSRHTTALHLGIASPAPSAHLGVARTAPVLSPDQPDTGRELVEDRG